MNSEKFLAFLHHPQFNTYFIENLKEMDKFLKIMFIELYVTHFENLYFNYKNIMYAFRECDGCSLFENYRTKIYTFNDFFYKPYPELIYKKLIKYFKSIRI